MTVDLAPADLDLIDRLIRDAKRLEVADRAAIEAGIRVSVTRGLWHVTGAGREVQSARNETVARTLVASVLRGAR